MDQAERAIRINESATITLPGIFGLTFPAGAYAGVVTVERSPTPLSSRLLTYADVC
jgi:hypothetical protein